MKSIIYALIGVILYAVQNTIIDVRLKQYSTVSLLVGWYVVLLPLAAGLYLYSRYVGSPTVFPIGSDLKLLGAVAVMFFIADFFYIGAFTAGGNVVAITILLVLMPVIGALMKFVWVKEAPSAYHLWGFVFAVFAVVFVAVGDAKKPTEASNTASQITRAR